MHKLSIEVSIESFQYFECVTAVLVSSSSYNYSIREEQVLDSTTLSQELWHRYNAVALIWLLKVLR
jgi:hypothetical protein